MSPRAAVAGLRGAGTPVAAVDDLEVPGLLAELDELRDPAPADADDSADWPAWEVDRGEARRAVFGVLVFLKMNGERDELPGGEYEGGRVRRVEVAVGGATGGG